MDGVKACLVHIWILAGGSKRENNEQQPLLAPHAFPHPTTVLTPPRPRSHIPPPIKPRLPGTASAPITPSVPTARPDPLDSGSSTPAIPTTTQKYGSISRAYQSRMQPLTKSSQPPTPTTGRSAHLMITSRIQGSKPFDPHPHPRNNPNISRSVSEPRSLYGLDRGRNRFEPHQLELTNGVEGVRRPRSATALSGISPLTSTSESFEAPKERTGRLGRSVSVGTGLNAGSIAERGGEDGDVVKLDLGLSDLLGPVSNSGRGKGRGRGRGGKGSVQGGRVQSG